MSSLQGDADTIPTGEPRIVSESADERIVEAKTLDFVFTQRDSIMKIGDIPYYNRTAERLSATGGTNPEAQINDSMQILDGKETERTITCQAKWKGITARSEFVEHRQEANDEKHLKAEAFDRTTIGYTVDLSRENEYLVVNTNQVRTVINPENENGLPLRGTERRETHIITRSVSDFAAPDDKDSIWGQNHGKDFEVASGRIYQIVIIDNDEVTIQSTEEIPEVIVRGPDGEYSRYSSFGIYENKFTSQTVMGLAEFRQKSGLALYIAEAELKVQNQPGNELILNPEGSYLIRGNIDAMPTEPFKDFVAKEVLRAI